MYAKEQNTTLLWICVWSPKLATKIRYNLLESASARQDHSESMGNANFVQIIVSLISLLVFANASGDTDCRMESAFWSIVAPRRTKFVLPMEDVSARMVMPVIGITTAWRSSSTVLPNRSKSMINVSAKLAMRDQEMGIVLLLNVKVMRCFPTPRGSAWEDAHLVRSIVRCSESVWKNAQKIRNGMVDSVYVRTDTKKMSTINA